MTSTRHPITHVLVNDLALSEARRLQGLHSPDKKIQWIKDVRAFTNCGLREAKDAVDAVVAEIEAGPRFDALTQDETDFIREVIRNLAATDPDRSIRIAAVAILGKL